MLFDNIHLLYEIIVYFQISMIEAVFIVPKLFKDVVTRRQECVQGIPEQVIVQIKTVHAVTCE